MKETNRLILELTYRFNEIKSDIVNKISKDAEGKIRTYSEHQFKKKYENRPGFNTEKDGSGFKISLKGSEGLSEENIKKIEDQTKAFERTHNELNKKSYVDKVMKDINSGV